MARLGKLRFSARRRLITSDGLFGLVVAGPSSVEACFRQVRHGIGVVRSALCRSSLSGLTTRSGSFSGRFLSAMPRRGEMSWGLEGQGMKCQDMMCQVRDLPPSVSSRLSEGISLVSSGEAMRSLAGSCHATERQGQARHDVICRAQVANYHLSSFPGELGKPLAS